MAIDPHHSFEIVTEADPPPKVLAGFSAYGLAGLTAADYLVDQLDLEPIGHVTTERLPPITPFEDGRPRHHTRLFSRPDLELAVLVNELFVPVGAAAAFATAFHGWAETNAVDELGILAGVPTPHGPDDHRVFHVATEDFAAERVADHEVPGMGSGFLDGVNAALLARGLESALRVGVFVTPVHARAPDVEAALRLVDTTSAVYGLSVDPSPLEQFAADIERHYQELAERLDRVEPEQRPDDRMYM